MAKFVCCTAIVCGLACFIASPGALGQTSGTSVPYQESEHCSASGTSCHMDFAVVPRGKRLEITNVTCFYLFTPASARVQSTELDVLSKTRSIVASQFITSNFQASDSSASFSVTTDPIFMFANHGQFFELGTGGAAASVEALCSISGHMITI